MATRLIAFVVLVMAFVAGSACADSYYSAVVWDLDGGYTELSGIAGGTDSRAYSINEFGQIAGWATNASGVREAVRWAANGTLTDLGVGMGYSINASGQVAGESNGRAIFWDANGNPYDIGAGTAYDVNDNGCVVGRLAVTNAFGVEESHAFVWSIKNGLADIGKPTGTIGVTARAINNGGTVAGVAVVNSDYGEAFVWNGPSDWSLIEDGTAMGINDAGQVAGNTMIGDGFLWASGDSSIPLGMTANSLNEAGLVVGTSFDNNAAIWTPGGSVSTLTEPAGYIRSVAYGANGEGQVVGWAMYVPEPPSCAALMLGLGGLIPLFRRRRAI